MDQLAQVKRGRHAFVACVAAVAVAEIILTVTCAAVLADWTLLLTGVGRVGVLAFVSRWALSGRGWGRVSLAVWLGSHVVLSALGALLVASSPDWMLAWAPHNPTVRTLPGYYWVFPTTRLVVLVAAGLTVFRSADVASFWADARTGSRRPVTAGVGGIGGRRARVRCLANVGDRGRMSGHPEYRAQRDGVFWMSDVTFISLECTVVSTGTITSCGRSRWPAEQRCRRARDR
jgi:hypothetical protein